MFIVPDRAMTPITPLVTVMFVFALRPTTVNVWETETSPKDSVPLPLVFRACPFVPSDTFKAAIPMALSATFAAVTASSAISSLGIFVFAIYLLFLVYVFIYNP